MASRFGLTLAHGERTDVLGPLFYDEASTEHDLTALPPLWSCTRYREIDAKEIDVLYPLLTYDRFGEEYRVQLFQLFSFAGGQNQNSTNAHRFTVFPFYFQQRSPVPAENYTAFLPFYGNLRNRLFRDEIHFVLWPAYVQTRKRDVVTDNFLVPFFHLRHGDGLQGWQFWPLLGAEQKKVTQRTNHWGDVENVGGHDKLFALWPIFSKQTTGLGTTNVNDRLAVLPLFSLQKSALRDSTAAPWPLGLSYTVDREKKYTEWGAPWPLIVFARGEGKTTSRVWPFFSQSHNATLQSDFYLWPLYKFNRVHADPLDRERTRILFFLYSDTVERNTETGKAKHRVDAWPFFTFRRDWNGHERSQALALLEPFLPNNKSIERNYSPLWALWRAEKNAVTGAHAESFLWNLYRQDTIVATNSATSGSVTNTKGSMLFGLVRWRVTPEGRKAKWFYLPGETTY